MAIPELRIEITHRDCQNASYSFIQDSLIQSRMFNTQQIKGHWFVEI